MASRSSISVLLLFCTNIEICHIGADILANPIIDSVE